MNQLSTDARCRVLACLVEDNSIRATVRITNCGTQVNPYSLETKDEGKAARVLINFWVK